MSKERRLGRGLEALLGRPLLDPGADALRRRTPPRGLVPPLELPRGKAGSVVHPPDVEAGSSDVMKVNVYEIDSNPFQPRREFDPDEIDSLAESIREHGVIQPIVVRRSGARYQLIVGERRLRAAIKAGFGEVPVLVREANDREATELAIVENLQRKDLNALEKAASFQQYLDGYQCTQEELAGRLQLDRSTVANFIRLLELPDAVQDALRSGAITQGHGRALLTLGDEHEQNSFCQQIVAEQWSVRVTEQAVQDFVRGADAEESVETSVAGKVNYSRESRPAASAGGSKSQLKSLEQQLRSALGTKVDIRQTAKGRGKIVIHFSSSEEFARLRDQLSGEEVVSAKRSRTA